MQSVELHFVSVVFCLGQLSLIGCRYCLYRGIKPFFAMASQGWIEHDFNCFQQFDNNLGSVKDARDLFGYGGGRHEAVYSGADPKASTQIVQLGDEGRSKLLSFARSTKYV